MCNYTSALAGFCKRGELDSRPGMRHGRSFSKCAQAEVQSRCLALMRTPFIFLAHVAVAVMAAMAPEVLAQAGPPLLTDDPETPGNRHWEINLAWTVSQRENARLF